MRLGGPHERHGSAALEVHLRLNLAEAYFRFQAASSH
jgi:hypothetical protein